MSNDAANRNLARVVVVPLTSSTGRQYPGEARVNVGGHQRKAMADQIMAADTLIEFLDQLRDMLMETYGDDITAMLQEASPRVSGSSDEEMEGHQESV